MVDSSRKEKVYEESSHQTTCIQSAKYCKLSITVRIAHFVEIATMQIGIQSKHYDIAVKSIILLQ